MARLSASDYRGLLGFLYAAGELEGTDPYPEQLLAQLRELVPCDVLTYGEHDPSGVLFRRSKRVRLAGEPLEPVTPSIREAQGLFRHQYPHPPADAAVLATLRWSDRLSRRELRRLDLYREVGQPLRINYSITVWLHDHAGRPLGYFAFDRRKPDFSDRALLLLQTLQPHLSQLARNAAQRPPSEPVHGLTPREQEILALVAGGKENRQIASLLYIAPGTVHKHLDNIYDKLGVHNRAQAVARALTSAHN